MMPFALVKRNPRAPWTPAEILFRKKAGGGSCSELCQNRGSFASQTPSATIAPWI